MVRSGSAAEVSVTGGVLLFNEGDDVLQLSKFLCNSQHARVGVAKAAEPDCPLALPLFVQPRQPPLILTVALPANQAPPRKQLEKSTCRMWTAHLCYL